VRWIFAAFWFLTGGAILLSERLTGQPNWAIQLGELRISPAWLAVLLGIYNVLRAVIDRMIRGQGRAQVEGRNPLRPIHRRTEEEPPNPDFDFREPPAQTGGS
jgi:hypothetical protein